MAEAAGVVVKGSLRKNGGTKGAVLAEQKRVAGKAGLAKGVKTNRPRDSRPWTYDPGGAGPETEAITSRLPTTENLAHSFLDTEPAEEKAQLKTAIAQSQRLDLSQVPEDDDEPSEQGFGAALSLPGFVADFLQGVTDRFRLEVKEVEISISTSVGPVRDNASEDSTFRLSVDDLKLPGVWSSQDQGNKDPAMGDTTRTVAGRQLSIMGIQGAVVTNESLFSALSQPSGSSSPVTTQSNAIRRSENKYRDPSPPIKSTPFEPRRRDEEGSLAQSMTSEDTEDSLDWLQGSRATSEDGQEDLQTENGEGLRDSLITSGSGFYSSDSRYEGSDTSSLTIRSHPDQAHGPDLRHSSLSRASDGSDMSDMESALASSDVASRRSRDGDMSRFSHPGAFNFDDDESQQSQASESASSSVSSLPAHSYHSSPSEDLTQSKLFSHEEAESMYLSATSHATVGIKDEPMPGKWTVDEGEDESQKEEVSPPEAMGHSLHDTEVDSPPAEISGDQSFGTSSFMMTAQPAQIETPDVLPISSPQAAEDYNSENAHEANGPSDHASDTSNSEEEASNSLSQNSNLRRTFLFIDIVHCEFPTSPAEGQAFPEPDQVKATSHPSSSNKMPGMFSSTVTVPQPGLSQYLKDSDLREASPKATTDDTQPMRLSLKNAKVFSDMSLVRLIARTLEDLPSMASNPDRAQRAQDAESQQSSSKLELDVDSFSFDFVDALRGISDRHPRRLARSEADLPRSETLLKLEIVDSNVSRQQGDSNVRTTLTLGRVAFGYPELPIISFDSGLRMRESVRDSLEPSGHDVMVTINKASRKPLDITLMTLPIHFRLDLARFDETMGWFGGLSSVLGLGNSVISTMTVTEPKASQPKTKKRGVHFEPTDARKFEKTPPKQDPRFTARVGGVTAELCGKECSVTFESSALKFVSRAEGIGLRIDKVRFQGPILPEADEESAATANIEGFRLEYLPTPKEEDLSRLLALLSPSRDPLDLDDDILLDTLLRQRRQGGLIRINIVKVRGDVVRPYELDHFNAFSEELKKLGTVAKYLPEDDRPGILTLALIHDFTSNIEISERLGLATFKARNIEVGNVTIPSLTLLGVDAIQVHHQGKEIIGEAIPWGDADHKQALQPQPLPSIMFRLIGDEAEPTLKLKLWNLRVEYHVSTIMNILGIKDTTTGEAIASEIAESVATILPKPVSRQSSQASSQTSKASDDWPGRIEVLVAESLIGLNPRGSPSKGFVLLASVGLSADLPKGANSRVDGKLEIKKLSFHVVDDVGNLVSAEAPGAQHDLSSQRATASLRQHLLHIGYVAVCETSSASIEVRSIPGEDDKRLLDVEIHDDLLVLETCADSTQTLLTVLNGLSTPVPPTKEIKYRTQVIPVEDMLASFTGDAYDTGVQDEDDTDYSVSQGLEEEDMVDDEVPQNLDFVSSFYDPDPEATARSVENSMLESDLGSLAAPPETREIGDKPTLTSFHEQYEVDPGGESLRFEEDHFGNTSTVGGTAHRWNSEGNTYDVANESKIRASPLRLRIRNVNLIWNLFDGYDWQSTRETISDAVADVESRAERRMAAKRDRRRSLELDDDEDSVIGDFLFNSIYIGIPANHDPRDLAHQVNRNLDDLASESESYATTTTTSPSPNRQGTSKSRRRRLKLRRSKHHKMTFELRGLSADAVVFPPDSGETQSSIDIRVQDLEIFDHVPTSTWKKFATYMHDMGERESGTSMVHIEMVNVKPVPDLAAVEIILKATILPLRLHVDQDALDFMTRFFEFRDPSAPAPPAKTEAPFLQRVEVHAVQVRLDFKPKRVDYAGLRSGRTTEFMNFFVLDGADMVLRHVIIYGVSGFDRLGRTLNDIWSPDVRRHQLPGVLAGLAPVRPLVNVGAGVRDLVAVPVREYRKDGRVVRAIQKGALAFAKTTTTELARLGAKLAIGTQTVLQNAEDLLAPAAGAAGPAHASAAADSDEPPEERAVISPYADQPVGVVQGLRGAFRHLERDLLLAKDAIVAIPGEVMESNTAGEAAKAVLRGAPTVVLRPALGVTKAVGQTLLGATNTLDKEERRRIEDVGLLSSTLCDLDRQELTICEEIQAPIAAPLGYYCGQRIKTVLISGEHWGRFIAIDVAALMVVAFGSCIAKSILRSVQRFTN